MPRLKFRETASQLVILSEVGGHGVFGFEGELAFAVPVPYITNVHWRPKQNFLNTQAKLTIALT
jgi:hypothetical protein